MHMHTRLRGAPTLRDQGATSQKQKGTLKTPKTNTCISATELLPLSCSVAAIHPAQDLFQRHSVLLLNQLEKPLLSGPRPISLPKGNECCRCSPGKEGTTRIRTQASAQLPQGTGLDRPTEGQIPVPVSKRETLTRQGMGARCHQGYWHPACDIRSQHLPQLPQRKREKAKAERPGSASLTNSHLK